MTESYTQAELFRNKFMQEWHEKGMWLEDWRTDITLV